MNDREFDELVRRLEPEAAAAPRAYQLRVALLALLGYAYIGLVIAVLLALAAGSAWLALNVEILRDPRMAIYPLVLVVFAGAIARSLWVTFPAPRGRRLRREDAPALFDEAERLRKALDAPRPHVILLSHDYNASVAQSPRLGILGFPRNYLVVGLPLLEALPAEQVRAVLAHEFAHLSRAHGRFGNWIYRVRVTWYQLMERLSGPGRHGAVVMRWFFDWYVPKFGAYTFVLSRRHEYEADRLAAAVVGPRIMAQTLVDLRVRGAVLNERFWPAFWSRAATDESPPADVFAQLAVAARAPLGDDGPAMLEAALKRRTDTADTHPELRDRIAALVGPLDALRCLADGSVLAPTPAITVPGSLRYLDASRASLASELGAEWREAMTEAWKEHRAQLKGTADQLAELRAKEESGALSVDERFDLAFATERSDGAEAAFPMFERLLADAPDHLGTQFAVGRLLLLTRRDEKGLAMIERVMREEEGSVLAGCQVVYEYLVGEGRLEEAARYRDRAQERARILEEAREERQTITPKDTYVPADLPADVVQALVARLAGEPTLRRAYLARKKVKHYHEESPVYVLAVVPRRNWLAYLGCCLGAQFGALQMVYDAEQKRAAEIAARVEVPDGVGIYPIGQLAHDLLGPLKKVPGAVIFDSRKREPARRPARSLATPRGTPRVA